KSCFWYLAEIIFRCRNTFRFMRWVLSLILFCCTTATFGQTLSREYFDRLGEKCPPEVSYYYSVRMQNQNSFSYDTVKFYYTQNNRLQAIGLGDQFGNRIG